MSELGDWVDPELWGHVEAGADVRWHLVRDADLGTLVAVTVDGQIVSTGADRSQP